MSVGGTMGRASRRDAQRIDRGCGPARAIERRKQRHQARGTRGGHMKRSADILRAFLISQKRRRHSAILRRLLEIARKKLREREAEEASPVTAGPRRNTMH